MRNMALSLKLAPVYIQKQHTGHSFFYERQWLSCVSVREELCFGELHHSGRVLTIDVDRCSPKAAPNATGHFEAK